MLMLLLLMMMIPPPNRVVHVHPCCALRDTHHRLTRAGLGFRPSLLRMPCRGCEVWWLRLQGTRAKKAAGTGAWERPLRGINGAHEEIASTKGRGVVCYRILFQGGIMAMRECRYRCRCTPCVVV